MSLKLSIKITNGDKRILLSSLTLSRLTGAFIGDRTKFNAVDVVSQGPVMVLQESFRSKMLILFLTFCLGPGLATRAGTELVQRSRIRILLLSHLCPLLE